MDGKSAGSVIWITGLARVGKTTTAKALAAALTARGLRPVVLDGDAMRAILGVQDYHPDARRRLAFIYARLAREIASQGFCVIVATISLFNDVHLWNRNNIGSYFEILLEAPMDKLSERPGSEIYKDPDSVNVVGREVEPEWPFAPTMRISTCEGLSSAQVANLILDRIEIPQLHCE